MTRQTGFYWLRFKDNGRLCVLHHKNGFWQGGFKDHYFSYISDSPIPEPCFPVKHESASPFGEELLD